MSEQMTFAASYVLASQVRAKLTKQATNAKTPLRTLVLQANMLDNIMDHLSQRREVAPQEKTPQKVHFSEPERTTGPQVHEYEVDSDSDSDSDSDYDLSADDEDDYYYSSDEESTELDEIRASVVEDVVFARKAQMPVIDLSDDDQLSVIFEEDEEESLPELTRSVSTSDSDWEEDHELHNVVASAQHLKSTDSLIKPGMQAQQMVQTIC